MKMYRLILVLKFVNVWTQFLFSPFLVINNDIYIPILWNFFNFIAYIIRLTFFFSLRGDKAAVEDDLWAAIQQAVNEDNVQFPGLVKDIMTKWSLQAGFPLVTVTKKDGTITLTQVIWTYSEVFINILNN